jgi:hypothetical protein
MTPDQLQKFCADGDFRRYLNNPFMQGEYAVASNAEIAIRTTEFEGEYPAKEDKWVDISAVIDRACKSELPMLPIPADLPPTKLCPDCDRKDWYAKETCDDCNGEGTFEHGRHEYDCKNCDGEGEIKAQCLKCGGKGYLIEAVQIGDAHFSSSYLALLADLPGIAIAPNGKDGAAYFKFDGGDGVLMPMRM